MSRVVCLSRAVAAHHRCPQSVVLRCVVPSVLLLLQVLLMTLQGPAPQLDDQPGRPHFSKV